MTRPALPASLRAALDTAQPVIGVVGDLVQDITALLVAPIESSGQVDAQISRHRGGSAANIAAGLARAHVRCRFFGRVGSDALGDMLIDELACSGVEVKVRRSGSTSTVVCLVDPGGERSFVADTAATAGGRHASDVPPAELRRLDLLHLSGYWLLGGVELEHLAGRVSFGGPITADLGNVSRVQALGGSNVRGLLKRLQPSVLFANRAEAEEAGVLDEAGVLIDMSGAEMCVVTGGAAPTVLLVDDTVTEVPVPPLTGVVDTTGAGDAFVAGFLAAAAHGADAIAATEVGHSAARQVIQEPGAAPRPL